MVGLFTIVAWLGDCGLLNYGGVLFGCFALVCLGGVVLHGRFGVWVWCCGLVFAGFGWYRCILVGHIWLGFW